MSDDFEETSLLGVVTLLMCAQLGYCAFKVKDFRTKLKIEAPIMTGPPEFERSLRAHQNTLEFFCIALPLMWMSGLYFHHVFAAVVGGVYVYARHTYITGYLKSPEDRRHGHQMAMNCIYVLLGTATLGVAICFLEDFTGIRLWKLLSRRRNS